MSGTSVLVVEDEILIAETIRVYLEERGYRVTDIAVSYEEAISCISNNKPDIALLDVRLYGQKSGIDVAKFIKEKDLNIPYVFLTSQYDSRVLENALDTNPGGYLTKPMQKETLWTTIELAYRNLLDKVKDIPKI